MKDFEKFEVWQESSLFVIYGKDEPKQNFWTRELESEISRGFQILDIREVYFLFL